MTLSDKDELAGAEIPIRFPPLLNILYPRMVLSRLKTYV